MNLKLYTALSLIVATTTSSVNSNAESDKESFTYPSTQQIATSTDYHGTTVADPYQWLEAVDSEAVSNWSALQNTYTETFIGPDRINERRQRLNRYTDLKTVRRYSQQGDRAFYLMGWTGSPTAALYASELDHSSPQHLAGPSLEALKADDNAQRSVTNFWPAPDGSKVAVLSQSAGNAWGRIDVIDVETGDAISAITDNLRIGITMLTWSHDARDLFIVLFDREDGSDIPTNARVVKQSVSGGESQLVFSVPDAVDPKTALMTTSYSHDSGDLIIEVRSGSAPGNRVYVIDPNSEEHAASALFADDNASRIYLGSNGDEFYFYSDENAPNGNVIAIRSGPKHGTRIVVPESNIAISAGSQVGGNVYGMFGNRIALGYLVAGGYVVKGFDLSGEEVYKFDVPETGAIWGQLRGDPLTDDFYYGFLGISEPGSTYHVTGSGTRSRVVAADTPFGADDVVATRVYVSRDDGAQVPLLIAHRADLSFDQPRPTIMYGYGGFGWVSFLWYQPHLMDWFENDGVFVIAGVRGGGEYGSAWHNAGKGRNRQVAIDDYLGAAQWLVNNHYTSTDLLVANGGSLSGSLAGAALIQRPELFAAGIIDYPVLDVLRYVNFGSARFWTEEIGNPDIPADFESLFAFSPYHAALRKQCFPPVLVRIGQFDTTTTPAHGYKFVAAAQTSQSCKNPVLLDVMEGAGHDYGSNPQEIGKSHAVALEFLMQHLDYEKPE